MPKPTFFNLPDDKRARFIDVALDEFAANPFDLASISRIVETLGIAKGSVYQYFDDKLDLFSWLLDENRRRRVAFFRDHPPPEGVDFFGGLRALYVAGLEGWRREPRWSRLALRALEPSKDPRLEALRKNLERQSFEMMRGELARAVSEGHLRRDLDLDTTTHLVLGLLREGLLAAFFARAGVDRHRLADHPDLGATLDSKAAMAVVDAAIDLMRSGLGPR